MHGRLTRVVLSLLALALFSAGTVALAAAGGHLRFLTAKAPVKITGATPPPIVGLAPGDRAQRIIAIRNQGKGNLKRVRFTLNEKRPQPLGRVVPAPAGKLTPEGKRWERVCRLVLNKKTKKRVRRCATLLRPIPSPLITDTAGLFAQLETCTKPWKRLPTAAPTYRCPGRAKIIVQSRRLPIARTLTRLPKVTPGRTLNLRLTLVLAPQAGNSLQGRAVVLQPTFSTGAAK